MPSFPAVHRKTDRSHTTLHRIELGEHHLTLHKLETVHRKLKVRLSDTFSEKLSGRTSLREIKRAPGKCPSQSSAEVSVSLTDPERP
jgi:hypothetical protein